VNSDSGFKVNTFTSISGIGVHHQPESFQCIDKYNL